MSIGQTIANLFGGASQAAAPQIQTPAQGQPTQPGNLPAQQTPAMASDPSNPNIPANGNPAPEPVALDQFKDIWNPVQSPAADGNKNLFNVDPKQLMEAASKVDFSKSLNPQLIQAVVAGGEDALKALPQLMNAMSQTVYAQNAMTTTKIVEQAVKQSREDFMKELPQHIKLQSVNDSLRNSNPALNHPAAAPILGALQQQLTVKYPNATPTELQQMASQYLDAFAGAMQKPQQPNQTQANSGEQDWSAYLSS